MHERILFSQVSLTHSEFAGTNSNNFSAVKDAALDKLCDDYRDAKSQAVEAKIKQLKFQLGYLFISHDLAVLRHLSDSVAVMYFGEIVEITDADAIYERPAHPYTQALLSAIPEPSPLTRFRKRTLLVGEVPSPVDPPAGCRFASRCPQVQARCQATKPKLKQVATGHFAMKGSS